MRNLLQAMKDGYGLLTGEGQFLVFFLISLYILWFFKKNEIKELSVDAPHWCIDSLICGSSSRC